MISFSGGRTSGLMTEELLKAGTDDKIVCFANTGLEDEETLIFVDKCTKRWKELYGIDVVWLEYWREGEKPTFRIVNFETASREGEPFSALLEYRNNLPNIVARYCTQELKVRTIKRYMLSIGISHWTNVVGIRYDEPQRWAKTKGIATREGYEIDLPLVSWKITKPDVLKYWKEMPFDLQIESDIYGNCTLCFLKGKGKKKTILRNRPKVAEFWIKWEKKRHGYTFFKRFSVEQLLNEVLSSPELFDAPGDDEPDIDCFCNTD